MSSDATPIHPAEVSIASTDAAPTIHVTQKRSNRLRSSMSASAPAGNPRTRTGRLAAVCMSATWRGEVLSVVINHVPAVSTIQLPVSESMDARRRFRKSERLRGAQTETGAD